MSRDTSSASCPVTRRDPGLHRDIDAGKIDLAEQKDVEGRNAAQTDPVEQIDRTTDGIGVNVAFEAVGGSQTSFTSGADPVARTFEIVRPSGTLVPVGHFTGEMTIDPSAFRKKYLTWVAPKDKAGVVSLNPNTHVGEVAVELVATDRAVTMTLNKGESGVLRARRWFSTEKRPGLTAVVGNPGDRYYGDQ